MARQILALTFKDVRLLARDRAALIVLFVMPLMFILIMSTALKGVFEPGTDRGPIALLVVQQDRGVRYLNGERVVLAQAAVDALQGLPGLEIVVETRRGVLTPEEAEALVAQGEYPLALIFPEDFSRRVVEGWRQPESPPAVRFVVDPGVPFPVTASVRAAVMAVVNRTVAYAQAPYRVQEAFRRAAASLPAPQQERLARSLTGTLTEMYNLADVAGSAEVRVETVVPAAFRRAALPTAVEQNVPAYTVFGMFFIAGVLAHSLWKEKHLGTSLRLRAAPLPRTALLLGKLLPYYLVNLVQVALMFGVGRAVLGLPLGRHPAGLVVVSLATAAAATGLGLVVAAWARSENQITGLSTLLALVLAAVGGMMVPVFVMPSWMQRLARLSPHFWALQGYQDILVRGLGVREVLPEVAILLGFAVAFYTLALLRFRWE